MARKVIAITTLGVGALLLLLGWVWRLSAPQLSYVAPEEVGFFAAVSGAALFATGLVLCLIRTAHARRIANYFSALLLVPGIMSGVGLALAASFLDPPMPDTSLAWLLCGLATCCGLLITISTVEPAEPLVDRVERIIAETGPMLGIVNKQKIGLGASLHVLKQVAPLIVLLVGFVGFLVWKDVKVVPWIALGLPIAWGVLALHELADLLRARWLGYRIVRVTIGGPWLRLPEFRLGGVAWVLGALPSHGRVEFEASQEAIWVAIRRVAWAGPASGAVLIALGAFALIEVPLDPNAARAACLLSLFGFVSLGQLIPAPHPIPHSDGFSLFMPERILRQSCSLREIVQLRRGERLLSRAPVVGEELASALSQVTSVRFGSEEERGAVLIALEVALAESRKPEHFVVQGFLIGSLARLAEDDHDFVVLEAIVARFLA